MSKKEILLVVGVVAVIVFVVVMLGTIGKKTCVPANLEMWGLYDEPEVFAGFIKDFTDASKCSIKIVYKKMSADTYEQDLISAFASGKGPDIWLMHNTWLPKHKDKIKEFPQDILGFGIGNFQTIFVEVAENDLTEQGKIYALPLYIDTLALFYNKDYLNTAGIASPPDTWEQLLNEDLGKLIKKNQWGGIERAGISLGTAENINRATDILSLIMLQNGTEIIRADKKSINISGSITLDGKSYYPGKEALRFYTDFSNPAKISYTWNRQMPYSIDAFANGKSAIMLSYAYQISAIKSKSPYFRYNISPMLQLKNRSFDINYANYWAYTVSKQSKSPEMAWRFLLYLIEKENAKRYSQLAARPVAQRGLIEWQKKDNPNLAVFADQILTARSWYQIDSTKIEKYFSDAIESIVLGSATIDKAIGTLTNQINLLMK
ncbi:MAG TPA: extracellular solute-binding protein [Candidatus Portnoybacteria bacterium]|jgi:multiple sugar transport system substrate-binding protein|nr:extracellular solute-binding protein [Candidatus Portnoybacteria bacterium]MDD5752256.1 extracellular solute-binding protein [Candidatus Portnoybacteria bacterium]HOZ16537.1 extracellular solute-binding protein [Candidatus Portnoybacteria bacterium]HPH52296.1 extracellular solute-binding protein [Candidatus Portnoybacteria bacterium]HPJ80415.1 extracellular solute-binding protein [Candidatus Portnoybacteria bacterium]